MPSDNLMTDIYGANRYNRYLAQQHASVVTTTKLVAKGTESQVTMAEDELVSADQCQSILVRMDSLFDNGLKNAQTVAETNNWNVKCFLY